MHRLREPLARWLLGAALGLPLCLGVWWWLLREPLLVLLAQVVGAVSPWLWPDAVLGLGRQGETGVLISLLPPLTDPPRLFMALPLSFNRASVILPLFWGLTLATPGRALPRRLLRGTMVLLPVMIAMVLLDAQFQLALYRTHLPAFTETPPADYALALPDPPTLYYLWGLGRQLAVLVLPVVAPLLVWLALHRAFLSAVIPGGWPRCLPSMEPAPPPTPPPPSET